MPCIKVGDGTRTHGRLEWSYGLHVVNSIFLIDRKLRMGENDFGNNTCQRYIPSIKSADNRIKGNNLQKAEPNPSRQRKMKEDHTRNRRHVMLRDGPEDVGIS